MTAEMQTLKDILVQIDEHPESAKIKKLASELRQALREYGEPGMLALALVGAELAA